MIARRDARTGQRLLRGRRAALAIASALAAPAGGAPPPEDPLTRLYYDFEVLNYCSLGSPGVRRGMRREFERLRTELQASEEELRQARSDAWQAAYAEWQNRGLGGFRAWCRNEGQATARRFENAP